MSGPPSIAQAEATHEVHLGILDGRIILSVSTGIRIDLGPIRDDLG